MWYVLQMLIKQLLYDHWAHVWRYKTRFWFLWTIINFTLSREMCLKTPKSTISCFTNHYEHRKIYSFFAKSTSCSAIKKRMSFWFYSHHSPTDYLEMNGTWQFWPLLISFQWDARPRKFLSIVLYPGIDSLEIMAKRIFKDISQHKPKLMMLINFYLNWLIYACTNS